MHSDPASSFHGRYSDGQTAQSVPADVRLTERGVEIGFPGAPQALVWSYAALGTSTPLTRKSVDALLTYRQMPGASLHVASPDFVSAVLAVAPQISSAAWGWRAARPWVLVAAGIVALVAGLWAADLSPARWVAGLLPDRTRIAVGEQVINSMVAGRKECTDAAGRAALDTLVSRLERASGTGTRFRVRVVDWGLLNAFAVPGEQIVLTRAIITQSRTPEEVAGVLAHEMGHGLELHPETAIVRIVGLTAVLELMTGGGGTIANVGLGLTQLSYTRAAEREADSRGLALLERAEVSSSGLIAFFRRIGEIERKEAGAPTGEWSIFRTHPQSEERAKAAAARPQWRSTPALSAAEWQALRNICGATKADEPKP
jgi:Zn-dependent protease with chaperone function